MAESSRETVRRTLTFENPHRIPQNLWVLPWAETHHRDAVGRIGQRFPGDIGYPPGVYRASPRVEGDPYTPGAHTDEWGCVFVNIHEGIIGEVRNPIVKDNSSWHDVRPPYEVLPDAVDAARDTVNRFCAETDLFVLSGCCPRPWERYQFLRGTENALVDVMMFDGDPRELLRVVHEYYMQELEFWVTTDIDAVFFMDDWGSQNQLLIPPPVWRELFKPLYKEYCDLAHSHGKFCFMHSDGNILDIYPDLIEIGVDAVNSQLFCMDMAKLAQVAQGRITFWGEIDRQHVLTSADPQAGRDAVRTVARHLYDPSGGIIAQFEMGPGCSPDTAYAVFDEWERVQSERTPRTTQGA